MSRPTPDLPEYLEGQERLEPGAKFSFACNPQLPCFNNCCADVNIMLTPLDVLQLARGAGMTTTEFLDNHTLHPITKDLHLPVVMLAMKDEPERRCSFVSEQGCTVYEHRPWACRMYPLGLALPPARAGETPEPIYFLFDDDHCEGRKQSQEWTAETWRRDQKVIERDEIEAGFRELVTHPWFIGGRRLDPKRLHMFYTACYDLDSFRSFIFESSFRERFELEDGLLEELENNDLALLRFAFRWLRFALFAEPTMKVRESAKADRSGK
jgi:Fe-S-cluster containining protein